MDYKHACIMCLRRQEDAEIAQHVSHKMLEKCKTHIFHVPLVFLGKIWDHRTQLSGTALASR